METKILGLVPFFDHLVFQHRYNSLFHCYIEVLVIVRGQASIGELKRNQIEYLKSSKVDPTHIKGNPLQALMVTYKYLL